MLTLSNFDNHLEAGVLDQGLKLYQANAVQGLNESDKNEWLCQVSDADEHWDGYAALGRGKKIEELYCACTQEEAANPENACQHGVALLFALREKMGISKKKVAKKRKKDAALELLETLKATQVFDFVKNQIAKDPGYKSQFLLYFSERKEVDEQQYKTIILDAIKAIKGRKKYITAGEASKIAKNLKPLLDQATQAEAKGEFLEAYVINKLFIAEVLTIQSSIKTNSVLFSKMVDRVKAFHIQMASNKKMPVEFRATFLKEIEEQAIAVWTFHEGTTSFLFKTWLKAAQTHKSLDRIEKFLLNDLEATIQNEQHKGNYASAYSRQPEKVVFIANFIINECQDKPRALIFLEKYCNFWQITLAYLRMLLQDGEAEKAYQLYNTFAANPKNHNTINDRLFVIIHYKIVLTLGKNKLAAEIAHNKFLELQMQDLSYLSLIKEASTPAEWQVYLAEYIIVAKKSQAHAKRLAYLHLLDEVGDYKTLYQLLKKTESLDDCMIYGKGMMANRPDFFLQLLEHFVDLMNSNQAHRYWNLSLDKLLEYLPDIMEIPKGIEFVKTSLEKLMEKRPFYTNKIVAFLQDHGMEG